MKVYIKTLILLYSICIIQLYPTAHSPEFDINYLIAYMTERTEALTKILKAQHDNNNQILEEHTLINRQRAREEADRQYQKKLLELEQRYNRSLIPKNNLFYIGFGCIIIGTVCHLLYKAYNKYTKKKQLTTQLAQAQST